MSVTATGERAALRLADLGKTFGKVVAVDGLSLEVRPGEMAGFLGPNGAGKSTTLYMICRLVRPTRGAVEIFGADVHDDFRNAIRHVGAMVEKPAFYENLSAITNLGMIGRLRGGVSGAEIDEVLERAGLFERRNDRVGTYSQGMKQRLGLGAALLGRPKLLVLDEPTNGMDPEGTREILAFLREKVSKDGLTVFLSSHLMHEVQEYCDRVFVINHGRLIASGKIAEILARPETCVRVVFRGAVPDAEELAAEAGIALAAKVGSDALEVTLGERDAAWLNRMLVSKGYEVSALVPKETTLKEFFLSITGGDNGGKHAQGPST